MTFLKNLNDRERRILKGGAAAAALLLFLAFVLLPLRQKTLFYRAQIARKAKGVEEMRLMADRYGRLKEAFDKKRRSDQGPGEDFTLFSFLDGAASEAGLKDRIKGMNPSVQVKDDYTESTVAVELEDVTLEPLVRYLHAVESAGLGLKIRKVDLKPRYSSPDLINATLIISAVRMKP